MVKIGMYSLPKPPSSGQVWVQSGGTNPMEVDVSDVEIILSGGHRRRRLQEGLGTASFRNATCLDLTSCSDCLATFPACAWSDGRCLEKCASYPCLQMEHPNEGVATTDQICEGSCAIDTDCVMESTYCGGCNCDARLEAERTDPGAPCPPGVETYVCAISGCWGKEAQCALNTCLAVDSALELKEEEVLLTTTVLGNQGTDTTVSTTFDTNNDGGTLDGARKICTCAR